jgi:hypothetical protein
LDADSDFLSTRIVLSTLSVIALWILISLLLSGALIPGVTADSVVVLPLSTWIGAGDDWLLGGAIVFSLWATSLVLLIAAQEATFTQHSRSPLLLLLASVPFNAAMSFPLYRFLLGRAPQFVGLDTFVFGLAITAGSFFVAIWLGYRHSEYMVSHSFVRKVLVALIWITLFILVSSQSILDAVLGSFEPYSWSALESILALTVYGLRPADLSVLVLALLMTYYDSVVLRPVLRRNSHLWTLIPLHLYVNMASPPLKVFLWPQRAGFIDSPRLMGRGTPIRVKRVTLELIMMGLLVSGAMYGTLASFLLGMLFFTGFSLLPFLVPTAILVFAMGFFMFGREGSWQNDKIQIIDGKVELTSDSPSPVPKRRRDVAFTPTSVDIIDKHTLVLQRRFLKSLLINFSDSKTMFEIYKRLKQAGYSYHSVDDGRNSSIPTLRSVDDQ